MCACVGNEFAVDALQITDLLHSVFTTACSFSLPLLLHCCFAAFSLCLFSVLKSVGLSTGVDTRVHRRRVISRQRSGWTVWYVTRGEENIKCSHCARFFSGRDSAICTSRWELAPTVFIASHASEWNTTWTLFHKERSCLLACTGSADLADNPCRLCILLLSPHAFADSIHCDRLVFSHRSSLRQSNRSVLRSSASVRGHMCPS